MRSPVIAFSILAAAAAVSGAPTSPNLEKAISEATKTHAIRQVPALPPPLNAIPVSGLQGSAPAAAAAPKSKADANDPVSRTQAMRQAELAAEQPSTDGKPAMAKKMRRAGDSGTAGGNAYSGAAQSADGGDVYQQADETGTIANDADSNNSGGGGDSFSGFATGGNGGGHGPGGNAYTGATGTASGGNVENYADGPDVTDATTGTVTPAIGNAGGNNAGGGGFSESGTARGGNAAGPTGSPPTLDRRAGDAGTAGGNAYSGATQDVSGGSVVNEADDEDGTVNNAGGNAAGGAGTTYSGDAIAGSGGGYGPGGNAYSGASGPADGGFVYNTGGTITNAGDDAETNTGGGGGVSQTGDARGGNA